MGRDLSLFLSLPTQPRPLLCGRVLSGLLEGAVQYCSSSSGAFPQHLSTPPPPTRPTAHSEPICSGLPLLPEKWRGFWEKISRSLGA